MYNAFAEPHYKRKYNKSVSQTTAMYSTVTAKARIQGIKQIQIR